MSIIIGLPTATSTALIIPATTMTSAYSSVDCPFSQSSFIFFLILIIFIFITSFLFKFTVFLISPPFKIQIARTSNILRFKILIYEKNKLPPTVKSKGPPTKRTKDGSIRKTKGKSIEIANFLDFLS
jgi:hypothetical protein